MEVFKKFRAKQAAASLYSEDQVVAANAFFSQLKEASAAETVNPVTDFLEDYGTKEAVSAKWVQDAVLKSKASPASLDRFAGKMTSRYHGSMSSKFNSSPERASKAMNRATKAIVGESAAESRLAGPAAVADYKKNFGIKEAAFPQQARSFGKNLAGAFGNAAVQGMAAAGVSALVAGTAMGATKAYHALTRERDFKRMMESNDDLHVMHQADPKRFNQAFNTLRSMNHEFASDPFVAGAYMRQVGESPQGGSMLAERVYFPMQKGLANTAAHRGAHAAAASMRMSPVDEFAALKRKEETEDHSLNGEQLRRIHRLELQNKEHNLLEQMSRHDRGHSGGEGI